MQNAPTGQTLRREDPVPITTRSGLCPGDIAALRELKGETRSISKGSRIRLRDGDPEYAVLVSSGVLFRYARTRDGTRQIVALYFPDDWASVEAFLGTPVEGQIAAMTRAIVRLIPRREGRELLARTPGILRLLTIETLFQTGVQAAWLTRNGSLPAIASLAHFLCEIVIRSGTTSQSGTVSCPFAFTQQMIAETLGLTPAHVNRTLRVLRDRRLADVTQGMLRVNDLNDLAAVAEFDPRYLQLRSTGPPDRARPEDFLTVVMDRPFEKSSW